MLQNYELIFGRRLYVMHHGGDFFTDIETPFWNSIFRTNIIIQQQALLLTPSCQHACTWPQSPASALPAGWVPVTVISPKEHFGKTPGSFDSQRCLFQKSAMLPPPPPMPPQKPRRTTSTSSVPNERCNPSPYRNSETRAAVWFENAWTGRRVAERPLYPAGPSDACLVSRVPRPPDPFMGMDGPSKEGIKGRNGKEEGERGFMGIFGGFTSKWSVTSLKATKNYAAAASKCFSRCVESWRFFAKLPFGNNNGFAVKFSCCFVISLIICVFLFRFDGNWFDLFEVRLHRLNKILRSRVCSAAVDACAPQLPAYQLVVFYVLPHDDQCQRFIFIWVSWWGVILTSFPDSKCLLWGCSTCREVAGPCAPLV